MEASEKRVESLSNQAEVERATNVGPPQGDQKAGLGLRFEQQACGLDEGVGRFGDRGATHDGGHGAPGEQLPSGGHVSYDGVVRARGDGPAGRADERGHGEM